MSAALYIFSLEPPLVQIAIIGTGAGLLAILGVLILDGWPLVSAFLRTLRQPGAALWPFDGQAERVPFTQGQSDARTTARVDVPLERARLELATRLGTSVADVPDLRARDARMGPYACAGRPWFGAEEE